MLRRNFFKSLSAFALFPLALVKKSRVMHVGPHPDGPQYLQANIDSRDWGIFPYRGKDYAALQELVAWTKTKEVVVDGITFEGAKFHLSGLKKLRIINCTFYDCSLSLESGEVEFMNNIVAGSIKGNADFSNWSTRYPPGGQQII
jgi:hypothetical protein